MNIKKENEWISFSESYSNPLDDYMLKQLTKGKVEFNTIDEDYIREQFVEEIIKKEQEKSQELKDEIKELRNMIKELKKLQAQTEKLNNLSDKKK